MFVDARAAAAQRTPLAAPRVPLLRSAIAVDPSRVDVRIALFRAQLAAGDPAAAIEALWAAVEEDRPLTGLGLTAAERYRLARELAEALERAGRLSEAVRYYTIALEGQPAATLPAVRARLAAVNEEIRRRATNTARRPEISASLDQPRLVRPLIPAAARTAAAAAPPAGARP
jgi:tetratricopeptide (TPR) repeat protein